MKDQGTGRLLGRVTTLAAITWINPLLGISWTTLRLLLGPGRWIYKILALSICGNLLFVFVLIVGYFVEDVSDSGRGAFLSSEWIQRAQGPLYFYEAAPGSEAARVTRDTVYVAFNGTIRAAFDFVNERKELLKEVRINDKCGRSWIAANLEDGTMFYERYADEGASIPQVSMRDKDGDGIPDVMVNWELQAGFEPEQMLTWRRTRRE